MIFFLSQTREINGHVTNVPNKYQRACNKDNRACVHANNHSYPWMKRSVPCLDQDAIDKEWGWGWHEDSGDPDFPFLTGNTPSHT